MRITVVLLVTNLEGVGTPDPARLLSPPPEPIRLAARERPDERTARWILFDPTIRPADPRDNGDLEDRLNLAARWLAEQPDGIFVEPMAAWVEVGILLTTRSALGEEASLTLPPEFLEACFWRGLPVTVRALAERAD